MRQIGDGASKTYLIGEKYRSRSMETVDQGDDQSMYVGYDYDTFRWTKPNTSPHKDGDALLFEAFGSAHSHGCHFVFVDGSVHTISYEIAPDIHQGFGNRNDRLPVGTTQL